MGNRISALLSRVGRHEVSILIALVLIAGGIWAFVELAEETAEGEARSLDRGLLLAMRNPADPSDPVGPRWLEELGRDFTALGSNGVLSFVSLSMAGYLLLVRKFRITLLLLIAVAGGLILSYILKSAFDRPRPELVPHRTYVYTASFPSGHAAMSAVVYLTLGALAARIHPKLRIKAYLLLLAVLLTVIVGISRVYLGVHWPTDVLGGWTLGGTWALLCWLVAFWLQRQGKMASDGESNR